ncbi:hypothetical protein CISG_03587 [Coccidioides immitis RMSCC 3703]|uniref:Uncharacterized protein n=1 Tax=Coccidioides immitis RMSCC 3703 TaxID=454286 RepID=A0A0J8QLX3_COCIT|nr:hypothetical protein CISG_03587 [Coccidioides immitis RMSCC 3703]
MAVDPELHSRDSGQQVENCSPEQKQKGDFWIQGLELLRRRTRMMEKGNRRGLDLQARTDEFTTTCQWDRCILHASALDQINTARSKKVCYLLKQKPFPFATAWAWCREFL